MHTNRRQKTTKAFALPTVLIASVVLLTILAVSVSATTAIRNTLKNQYYAQLAQVAGEAGVAYAKACLATSGNVPQWTDAKPLTPATDCTGTQNVGLPVRVLIVGGGGGGANTGGGGGGGGMISNAASNINIDNYYVGVGGGGLGKSGTVAGSGAKGDQSSFNGMIAEGGGYGATHGGNNGGPGGSGGGGGMTTGGVGGSGGVASAGNPGGIGSVAVNWVGNSGGGGGAGNSGGAGGNLSTSGTGGIGRIDNITGANVYYGGGGAGGEVNGSYAGTIQAGGGGSATIDAAGGSGVSGLGGGGGGGSYNGNYFSGGNGGAGVVIISYPTASGIVATGGTITTSGANKIHTFTGSGYFNVTSVGTASCPSAPSCSVTVNDNVRSSFSVPKPTVDANGRALTISNTGYVEVTRSSTGAVWRTYRQPSVQSAVVPDLCSGNATAERGWAAAVRATTQDSIGAISSAQTITIANTNLNSGQMYFRKDFNVSFAGDYDLTTFTNSSQDVVDAFVDGTAVITSTSGSGNGSINLSAGCHTIVVELTNNALLPRASDVTVALVKAGDALPTVVSDTTWRAAAGDTEHFSENTFFEAPSIWETAVSAGTWGTAALPWGAGPVAWAGESGDPLAQWTTTRFSSGGYDRPAAAFAWFRQAQPFTLSEVTDVRLSAYCDDLCTVYADGVMVHNVTGGALASKIITLQPGQHTLGVRLNNLNSAVNPSAFLLSAVDTSNGTVVARSNIDWNSTQSWSSTAAELYSYDKTYVPTPVILPTANVRVLVVGGGGGGGSDMGGGGGGGGVVYNGALSIAPGSHRVVTGSGGAGANPGVSQPRGASGGNSVFDDVRGYGGGGGGSEYSTDSSPPGAGGSAGGSAGGVQLTRSVGVFGQGNGSALSPGSYYPTGGGGAGSAGLANPGHGGAGVANAILGTSYIFGGGGGGSGYSGIGGNGGSGGGGGGAVGATTGGTGGLSAGSPGGGGTAGVQTNTPGGNGGANTGGGGGGGSHYNSNNKGGNGGSGIVVVSYPTGSMVATGGTISTSGGYTIHRFNTVGTFDFKVISIQ